MEEKATCSTTSLGPDEVLCITCRSSLERLVADRIDQHKSYKEDPLFVHDYHSLCQCAVLSCRICLVARRLVERKVDAASQLNRQTTSSLAGLELRVHNASDEDKTLTVYFEFRFSRGTSGLENDRYDGREIHSEFLHLRRVFGQELLHLEALQDSTASQETLNRILKWSRICIETHTSCKKWRDIVHIDRDLPTRLLAVCTGPESQQVKLISTERLPMDTPYTTLSHCWGGESSIKLTRHNIGTLIGEVPWEELPKTFREAIVVTRSLGIAYLWIDALCIMQDSSSDWGHEAARMTQVYANSFLNISADASVNSHGGLFRARDAKELQSYFIPVPETGTETEDTVRGYCCYDDNGNWMRTVERSPLSERGWVLQERFIAPRVIHFAEDQVYWECSSCVAQERFPVYLNLKDAFRLTPRNAPFNLPDEVDLVERDETPIFAAWLDMVNKYTSCKLTFSADLPTAIAGLARAFCVPLGVPMTDYVCGLWRPTFIRELGWESKPGASSTPSPSWSWLSVDGGTWRTPTAARGTDLRDVAELLEVNTTPIGDPFGPVSSGFAKIRAPLCLAAVRNSGDGTYSIEINGEIFQEDAKYTVSLDNSQGMQYLQSENGSTYLLLLGLRRAWSYLHRRTEQPSWTWVHPSVSIISECICLVFTPTGTRAQFRRLGLLTSSRFHDGDDEQCLKFWSLLWRQFRTHDVAEHLYEDVDENFFYTITLV